MTTMYCSHMNSDILRSYYERKKKQILNSVTHMGHQDSNHFTSQKRSLVLGGTNSNFMYTEPQNIYMIFGRQSNLTVEKVKLLIDTKIRCALWFASKMTSNEGRPVRFANYQTSVVVNLIRLLWKSIFPQEFVEYPTELKQHLRVDPDVLYSVVMMSRGGGKTLSCCYGAAFAFLVIPHFNCGFYAHEDIAIKNKNQVKSFIQQMFMLCNLEKQIVRDNAKSYDVIFNGSLKLLSGKAATDKVCIFLSFSSYIYIYIILPPSLSISISISVIFIIFTIFIL